MFSRHPILKHLIFWLFAYCLLTLIYSTAFGSYELGAIVILMLLPVHMLYFYLISRWVLPRFFFRGKYVQATFAVLGVSLFIATVYRLNEIFISDPYIFDFYKSRDSQFTWTKLETTRWRQFINPHDFVNAFERSNVVVWIGITLKLFTLWHERRQAALQAELNFLKSQLNPHFLFNGLNNLYALSLNNAPQTPEIILGLSNILRYVLYECNADHVLLKRDIEVLKDYIRLEKLRYEERLELNVNISEHGSHWKIAPLLMLPLVENAFKHGAAETVDSPWINIEIFISGDQLILKISNSKPETGNSEGKKQQGRIGIANVQQRLKLLYPGMHSFKWYDEEDCFITELNVPLIASNKSLP
ncbi:sensor histidine kinase [Pseudobacter ginsenosidimutans]|uniref:Histidine kinase n=1 Tax=Pseudobacter ginsenosidimutans TaxID=661488 RepID=A0A4Q7MR32_9BACT|nr:histidine kinase [Pseudobacter ginsenosidimutans]QEC40194.1 histidine kinase [Pseudobacter ginsenosidimutans]RZS69209.1 histidine kinase [Pseudobacter ginsenosidimutans]